MPFPNQHAAVAVAASKFDQKTFRTINIGDKNSGITAIVGRKKGEKTTTVHSYRFDKKKFTPTQAKKWLKDHDISVIEFTPAGDNDKTLDFDRIPENLEYKTFHLDIRETKEDDTLGVFRGAMATEHKDRGNDIIAPDAFDNTLKRYNRAKKDIKLYYQHNTFALPIGIIPIKSVVKDGKYWNVKGELNLETQLGREVYSLMKQGALSDLSIGFTIVDQDIKVDKKDPEKYIRIIKELELWEVSVVGEPMNPKAIINEVKNELPFLFTDILPVVGDKPALVPFNPLNPIETISNEGTTDTMIPNDLEKYKFKKEKMPTVKICIEDIEHIKTREEFNEILSKSGVFSRSACEFLASRFNPKIDQSKSVIDSEDENQVNPEIEEEINAELKTAEISKIISDRVAVRKLDELLCFLNQIKDDYNDRRNNSKTGRSP
jgi:HK97 family phage prohead protease